LRSSAEKAKAELDGVVLGGGEGLPCRIAWGESNTLFNCVHVRFEVMETEGEEFFDVTEEDIVSQFSTFGNIVRITLPRMMDGSMKGYAFVDFSSDEEGQEAAANAIHSLNQKVFKERFKLVCHFGKKQQASRSTPRPKQMREGSEYQQYAMEYYPYSPVYMPHNNWNPYYVYPVHPGMSYDPYSYPYVHSHANYGANTQITGTENSSTKTELESISTDDRPVAAQEQQ
jgi:RNA recognition motif-containing protein